jgi:hypothetical protein
MYNDALTRTGMFDIQSKLLLLYSTLCALLCICKGSIQNVQSSERPTDGKVAVIIFTNSNLNELLVTVRSFSNYLGDKTICNQAD